MNAQNYEPINVLNLFKGFGAAYTTQSIIPYRFERKDGRTHSISEIRVVNKIRSGGKDQFHFDVSTGDGIYCRLLFDTHTFTWRLVEERKPI